MAQLREKEKAFLAILQEDNNREKINQRTLNFKACDWQELYELSIRHGLSPAFYTRLLNLNLGNLPAEFLSRLKNIYLLNLKRNIILERETLRIVSYLQDKGIPAIPLKGPILARYLYNDLALRQASCDLDFLVSYEKFNEAQRKLEEAGFISTKEINVLLRPMFVKYSRGVSFNAKSEILGDYFLDLHWDIRGFFTTDTPLEEFWQSTREINLDGHKVLIPSNEEFLLYLSLLSLSTFEFVELRYLYDIHMFISKFKKELDWQKILEKAENRNLKFYLFFALKLSQELFHGDVPEGFLSRLRPNFIKKYLLKFWINQKNILQHNQAIALSYNWRYLISSYLHAKNFYDFLKRIYKKTFLPINEVMDIYNQPTGKISYWVYIKRLLKPFIRFLNSGNRDRRLQCRRTILNLKNN